MPGSSILSSASASTSNVGRSILRSMGKAVTNFNFIGKKPSIAFDLYPEHAKSVRRSAVARCLVGAYFGTLPTEQQVIVGLDKVSVRESLANKLVAFVRENGNKLMIPDFELTNNDQVKYGFSKLGKAVTAVSGWPAPIADGTMKLLLVDSLAVFADMRNHWQTFQDTCVTSPFVRSPTTPHMWHVWGPATKMTAKSVFGRLSSHDQLPALGHIFSPEPMMPSLVTTRKRAHAHQAGDDDFFGPAGKRARGGSAHFDPTPLMPAPAAPINQPHSRQGRKRRPSGDGQGSNKRVHIDQ